MKGRAPSQAGSLQLGLKTRAAERRASRAAPPEIDKGRALGGRVHALVRFPIFRPTTYARCAAGDIQPPSRFPPLSCHDATPYATDLRRLNHTLCSSLRHDIIINVIPFLNQESNARHHPRPYSRLMRGALMGRRVHAVVMLRLMIG
jgi:hypothetical protein